MFVFNVLIISGLLFSIATIFFIFTRLIKYRHEYPLPEDKYTKLFGFITKGQVMVAYFIAIALQIIFFLWFLFLM